MMRLSLFRFSTTREFWGVEGGGQGRAVVIGVLLTLITCLSAAVSVCSGLIPPDTLLRW